MNEATRSFIKKNLEADVRQLALQGGRDNGVDLPLALRQIAGRQVARRKLPTWAALDEIVYPVSLSLEQCSSEQTACYKTDVCRRLLASHSQPLTLVDLTGGFGVDFTMMSKVFQRAIHVEHNVDLQAIAASNFMTMGCRVETFCADGVDFLNRFEHHASVIFLDPARRNEHGGRTYGIADCTPNVLNIKEQLLSKADFVMLKLSPMLDWRKAVHDLGESFVREVHIVSVQNECKELLVIMQACNEKELKLFCVNDRVVWEVPVIVTASPFWREGESMPTFLYEPNASIMKAGCFSELAAAYGLQQLAPNSHLFVADSLIADFPGRSFQISAISSMNKKELKTTLHDVRQANVTVRNFPLSVAELRKRLRLADGGTDYIFATTLADDRHVLFLCRKITL
ncbi:MAG: SAM-dependent methyltransferase [Prevotella sp.]|nr:SAM-dependent methyltransferase [Prevotella sp.]